MLTEMLRLWSLHSCCLSIEVRNYFRISLYCLMYLLILILFFGDDIVWM